MADTASPALFLGRYRLDGVLSREHGRERIAASTADNSRKLVLHIVRRNAIDREAALAEAETLARSGSIDSGELPDGSNFWVFPDTDDSPTPSGVRPAPAFPTLPTSAHGGARTKSSEVAATMMAPRAAHGVPALTSLPPPRSTTALSEYPVAANIGRPGAVVWLGGFGAMLVLLLVVGTVAARERGSLQVFELQPAASELPAVEPTTATPSTTVVEPSASTAQLDASAPPVASSGPAPVASTAPSASVAPPEPVAFATTNELETAVRGGEKGLADLAAKYPKDPTVLRALMKLQDSTKSGGSARALQSAAKLAVIDPRAAKDQDVRRIILRAVSGPPEDAEFAVGVLSKDMGADGLDLLYEVLTARDIGQKVRDRVGTAIADPAVRALASPALLVALELRAVSPPCARASLLKQVQEVGDARSLVYILPMTKTKGCGVLKMSDCTICPVSVVTQAQQTIAVLKKK